MRTRQKQGQRNGSAVVAVLGIISVIMIVSGMLARSATRQMRATQITREMLKARLIAESGLNKAYNAVKTDFDRLNGFTETLAFGGGSCTVRAEMLTSEDGRERARLVSEGVCGLGRARVSADLENVTRVLGDDQAGSVAGDYFDLLFDLLVGGILDLKGNFKATVTDIHANGNVKLTGSSNVDAMRVSSTGTIEWKKNDGTVTLLTNQSPVEILSAALTEAINAFIAVAEENGAVYAHGSDIPSSPPGGVAVCTGSSDGWSKTGTGTFIFLGDVKLQGSGVNLTAQNGYPALIVLGTGEVKINADAVIRGAVIMPNASFHLNGHAVIYGAVLIGQGMTGNGTADLYAGDSGQGFSLPPTHQVEQDYVVVTAWH
ncbi:MAG TPA: hypothetical protein PLJ32_04755 [Kiritimatiellia bacterium]|nr:hypothetical protein [Kiritimatiellia bacterium]